SYCYIDCHHCSIPWLKWGRHVLQAYCTDFYAHPRSKSLHGAASTCSSPRFRSGKLRSPYETMKSLTQHTHSS
ncbi:hypothetical protein N7505_011673, partial [Penicillium chrysogenum]